MHSAICSSNVGVRECLAGVEGQWDFYPNLRLKIDIAYPYCMWNFLRQVAQIDTKSTLPLPLCHKSQMLSQTLQLALSGGAKGGGSRDTCPVPAVPRQLAGRWEAETAAAS